VYGATTEESELSYDSFVEKTRQRAVQAYYNARVSLQKSAERNKKYYDLGLKGVSLAQEIGFYISTLESSGASK